MRSDARRALAERSDFASGTPDSASAVLAAAEASEAV